MWTTPSNPKAVGCKPSSADTLVCDMISGIASLTCTKESVGCGTFGVSTQLEPSNRLRHFFFFFIACVCTYHVTENTYSFPPKEGKPANRE